MNSRESLKRTVDENEQLARDLADASARIEELQAGLVAVSAQRDRYHAAVQAGDQPCQTKMSAIIRERDELSLQYANVTFHMSQQKKELAQVTRERDEARHNERCIDRVASARIDLIEAQAAAMREALELVFREPSPGHIEWMSGGLEEAAQACRVALAFDAGRGWKSPEILVQVREKLILLHNAAGPYQLLSEALALLAQDAGAVPNRPGILEGSPQMCANCDQDARWRKAIGLGYCDRHAPPGAVPIRVEGVGSDR